MTLQRRAIEGNTVSINITKIAKLGRAKRFDTIRVRLGDIPGAVNFVIHYDQDAFASRLRRRCSPNCIQ